MLTEPPQPARESGSIRHITPIIRRHLADQSHTLQRGWRSVAGGDGGFKGDKSGPVVVAGERGGPDHPEAHGDLLAASAGKEPGALELRTAPLFLTV
jgi:hypothetical protein